MIRLFKWLFTIGLVLSTLIVAIAAYGIFTYFDNAGPLEEPTHMVVKSGQTLTRTSYQLAKNNVISYPRVFLLTTRLMEASASIKAGEYRFEANMSPREVLQKLTSGDVFIRKVTVPEGYTVAQTLAVIAEEEALEGDITVTAEEGRLLPETYHYQHGDTKDDIIKRMQADMQTFFEKEWPKRDKDLPFTTMKEALTLASLVEKETGVKSERRRVAAVYINRLRANMLLQADPTVIYAVTQGKKPLGRPISKKDLKTDSPYNTYLYPGLPPGPIANPGKAAILATLHPEETDEYYFVADGTGGHVFGKNLAEHNRNVQNWRKIEKKMRLEQQKNK